jgi:hypothetical protein
MAVLRLARDLPESLNAIGPAIPSTKCAKVLKCPGVVKRMIVTSRYLSRASYLPVGIDAVATAARPPKVPR